MSINNGRGVILMLRYGRDSRGVASYRCSVGFVVGHEHKKLCGDYVVLVLLF